MESPTASQGVARVLHVSFNQDFTSISVGLPDGYALYSVSSTGEKLEQLHRWRGEAVSIVERHYSSSLIALVMQAAPRKLRVMHYKKGTEICCCSYQVPVLSVRLSRQRLVVCLEDSLHLHSLHDMKVVHTVRECTGNRLGLCALCSGLEACLLAYPDGEQRGSVCVFDAVAIKRLCLIPAHASPLAAMSFNSTGTRLATGSEKGTVIRVFSIPDSQMVAQFRRGVRRCVLLRSLAFSRDSSLLACCSNTETLHVFCLDPSAHQKQQQQQEQQLVEESVESWASWAVKATTAYLLPSAFSLDRDFATARVAPDVARDSRSGGGGGDVVTCALATVGRRLRLLCARERHLRVFELDERIGGECRLLAKLDLLGELPDAAERLEQPDSPDDAAAAV